MKQHEVKFKKQTVMVDDYDLQRMVSIGGKVVTDDEKPTVIYCLKPTEIIVQKVIAKLLIEKFGFIDGHLPAEKEKGKKE